MIEWKTSAPVPFSIRELRKFTKSEQSADLNRLRSALDAIPNSGDKELSYDEWRNVIFAIHFATGGSDEGAALAHAFSARSSKYDADFLDSRVWPYVRSDRDGATITDRTIYAAATQHGWQDPNVLNAFDSVDDAESARGGATPTEGVSRFHIRGAAEARKTKVIQWWVKGVIPKAELVVVYGAPGSGKSFLTLDICAAISKGEAWRGKRTKQGRILYIAAEGAAGFGARVEAYCVHTQSELDKPQFGYIDGAPNLLTITDLDDLIKSVRAYGHVDVIVVDTFARVMPGGDENSSQDVGKAIAHCKVLSQVCKSTVILVHHSGKDASKGARGWSGLNGASDAELEVTRSADVRAVTVSKQKDGQDGESFGFKLLPIPIALDEDGDTVSSCVVEHTDDKPRAKARLGAKEQLVIDAMGDLVGPDGTGPQTDELVTAVVDQMPFDSAAGKRDTRRQHALRAIESLRQKGVLNYAEGRVQLP